MRKGTETLPPRIHIVTQSVKPLPHYRAWIQSHLSFQFTLLPTCWEGQMMAQVIQVPDIRVGDGVPSPCCRCLRNRGKNECLQSLLLPSLPLYIVNK